MMTHMQWVVEKKKKINLEFTEENWLKLQGKQNF